MDEWSAAVDLEDTLPNASTDHSGPILLDDSTLPDASTDLDSVASLD